MPLFEAMKEYNEKDVVPFDVPGHKHGKGLQEFTEYFGEMIMKLDVNSMKQLDNLSNPTGVIKESQQLLAEAYGADFAHFLVNGTSSGIQAMIMSVCDPGDKIIIPRNAHKSAFNALILSDALPIYIYPDIHEELGISCNISIESVKEAICTHPDAKALFVINPTYYGMTCNLKEIINYCHDKGVAVLVDEAHGAHFAFSEELPDSAMQLGADMAAVSLHKTGGSLTQSSALLVNEGFINHNRVKTILNLTQTTSASYLLMSSLDVCRKNLVCNGKGILKNIIEITDDARTRINEIKGYYAFGKELIGTYNIWNFDATKLGVNVIGVGLTGFEVYDILRDEYNIQVELADMYNILAIISLGDDKVSINRLVEALKDIAYRQRNTIKKPIKLSTCSSQVVMTPRDAFYSGKVNKRLEDCEGWISGESIMVYPPGIPLLVPGEEITIDIIQNIKLLKEENCVFNGTEDSRVDNINVIDMINCKRNIING